MDNIVKTVLIVLAVLVILYLLMNFFTSSSTSLTTLQQAANNHQKIEASTLPSNNKTSNYTYSMWMYVDDWNYKFGTEKEVLVRKDQDHHPSPSVVLGAMENDIIIKVACYPTHEDGTNPDCNPGASDDPCKKSIVHQCNIKNFPLQSWVNVIISLYGRTLDVYIDGKLVRTCMLPGVAKVSPKANISVTPHGGFSGYTANFQYWDDATNPQQAYNIYKNGFGGSMLGDLFNKYRIKVSFLEDNKEQGSFEI